ncbi:TnsA-like heteromeric transposase endonuclease subunit [Streptomyces alboflavus]|uniref:TnsA-like heteromeric transposase endonuclease subunit n=1 Tax=Streptomyces alboflavus TaxID=67267 RepID=UPI0004BF2BDF|nr:TnsA-like heteromeric transposase endonuclease subunit [Streptomyces alboflavus]
MDAADFWVTMTGPDGARRQGPLSVMWPQRFEASNPSRSFPAYRGQINFTGWYWSATCRGHVPYESWLERDHLIRLDFDRTTVAMAAQPFRLAWDDGVVGHLEHTPDFFVRRGDGTGLVVDVRPDERVDERDAVRFTGTRGACELVGWDYERVGAMEAVLTANLRWLAGFRHTRVMREDTAAALRKVFAGGAGLLEGARAVGDQVLVLPVLYHLLWCQNLVVDLQAAVLSPSAWVTPGWIGWEGDGDGDASATAVGG